MFGLIAAFTSLGSADVIALATLGASGISYWFAPKQIWEDRKRRARLKNISAKVLGPSGPVKLLQTSKSQSYVLLDEAIELGAFILEPKMRAAKRAALTSAIVATLLLSLTMVDVQKLGAAGTFFADIDQTDLQLVTETFSQTDLEVSDLPKILASWLLLFFVFLLQRIRVFFRKEDVELMMLLNKMVETAEARMDQELAKNYVDQVGFLMDSGALPSVTVDDPPEWLRGLLAQGKS